MIPGRNKSAGGSGGGRSAAPAGCSGLFKFITWLGTFRNGAVPDLVRELGPVVVHVDHVDHNVDGVFHLVPIQVHRMSSQLKATKTARRDDSLLILKQQ